MSILRFLFTLLLVLQSALLLGEQCVETFHNAEKAVASFKGKELEYYDLANIASSKVVDNQVLMFIKKAYRAWEGETIITINAGNGHAALLHGKQRYDGRLFFIKDTTLVKARPVVEAGLAFNIKNLPAEAREALSKAMENGKGKKTLTCVNGLVGVLKEAGFEIPNYILPRRLIQGLVNGDVSYKGQNLKIEIAKIHEGSMSEVLASTSVRSFTFAAAKEIISNVKEAIYDIWMIKIMRKGMPDSAGVIVTTKVQDQDSE